MWLHPIVVGKILFKKKMDGDRLERMTSVQIKDSDLSLEFNSNYDQPY